jgi:hypothetical protein
MRVVLTLLARGDAEVVAAQVAFHLHAGVDLVLAEAGGASAGLERYEHEGRLHVVADTGGSDGEARTRLARAAATEHGADWVVNASEGEFWWPRAESLPDVLAPIPPRYTIVQGLLRPFVAATRRRAVDAGATPAALLRPAHRADPDVVVRDDGTVSLPREVPLRAWYPLEVLRLGTAPSEDGELVEDTRLRDALLSLRAGGDYVLPGDGASPLRFRTPDIVDDAAYAVECAAVGEVDLPRLEAYVAELEQRVAFLEERLWPRTMRAVSGLFRRRR